MKHLLTLVVVFLCLLVQPVYAKHRLHHHYLGQGELRQAQNTQPWAWSKKWEYQDQYKAPNLGTGLGKGLIHTLRIRPERTPGPTSSSGIVTVATKAGPITIAADAADKFVGFINALPYMPKAIGCYASGGHISGSLHYSGHACDIDQTARGKTSSEMYNVAALAAQFGLRDGCTFGDCGHIDTGQQIARRAAITRLASNDYPNHRRLFLRLRAHQR